MLHERNTRNFLLLATAVCTIFVVFWYMSSSPATGPTHATEGDFTTSQLDAVPRRAIVQLRSAKGEAVSGTLHLRQDGASGQLTVEGTITGLTQGLHGFHIHEFGEYDEECKKAGAHYNPHKKTHGDPKEQNRHIGDLGNIEADAKGISNVKITDSIASLYGPYSILGRSIVVHQDPDDLGKGSYPDSLTTGHAGRRLACGVIALSEQ